MPTAPTSPAGQNAHAAHAARMAESKAKAQSAARELNDPGTVGRAPLATIPEPPPLFADEPTAAPAAEPTKAARTFSISTVVAYRGRVITIAATGMTLDQFCDLMDDRGYAAPAPLSIAAPVGWQTLPDGTPICPRHHVPMRKRERQGDSWYSHNVGKGPDGKDLYCKGYHGKDSPGYEVD